MHKVLLVSLLVAFVSSVAVAQCQDLPAVPVTDAPYSAVRHVITVQRKSDGSTSRSEATEQEARDSKGRSYRAGERRWSTDIDGKSVEKSELLVTINDPIANTETKWDTTVAIVKIVHSPAPPLVPSTNQPTVDAFSFDSAAKHFNGKNLGTKTIEGVSTEGIGYQTDNSSHECWSSPDLKIVVLQTSEYPDHCFTSRLENIRIGEPDVSSYKPPSSYSVNHIHLEQSGKTNMP
jgi:hypothetical protein